MLCVVCFLELMLLLYTVVASIGSPAPLLSYSMVAIALRNTIILIISLISIIFQPYPN